MEALGYLRGHLIKARDVRVDGDDLVFLDLDGAEVKRLPKHTPTAYVSKTSKKPYDLLAVFTCYKYAALMFGEYVTKCRAEKAAMVTSVDKKELIAYLKGDIDSSAQIVGSDAAAKAADAKKSDAKDGGSARDGAKHDSGSAHKKSSRPHGESDGADAKKRKVDHHHSERAHRENLHPNQGSSEAPSTADLAIKRILDKEFTLRNRTTVLNASKKTFENVLKTVELVNAETKEKIEKASKAALLAPVTARKEQVPLSRLMKEKIHGTPIIVVPAGFSDLFTMLNAKDFLEQGVYVSNMQKKAEGHRKAQSFTVTHEEDGEQFLFKVVDSVSRFRDKDWKCVVAVIASGQAWQFKGWKWKFPLEVFKKVCGIHIYQQGSQLSSEIKQWDVKILMIHPDKRHLDKVASKEFWRHVFEFLRLKLQRKKKPGEQLAADAVRDAPTTTAPTVAAAAAAIAGASAADMVSSQGSNVSALGSKDGSTLTKHVNAIGANGPMKTSTSMTGTKNLSNKVVPENQTVPAPLTVREQLAQFLDNKYVTIFMTIMTLFALFGDDLRLGVLPKSGDNTMWNLLFVCFLSFLIELIVSVYARPNYFNKGLGFAFWLDFVSTISIIPDVGWIWELVVGDGNKSNSQAAALKAGRASRAGTKAGRIVRLVRLIRMVRMLRVMKDKHQTDESTVQISEPSKIGKVLTEKTTRRLVVLVLVIIIVSPLIGATIDLTEDEFQQNQFDRIHRTITEYNSTGEISMDTMQGMVHEYVQNCEGYIVNMTIVGIDYAIVKSWVQSTKFQDYDPDADDWIASSNFSRDVNPKTLWKASYWQDDPFGYYRSTELNPYYNLACNSNEPAQCSSVYYEITSITKSTAQLNMGKTVIIMFCFAVSILVLTRDAELMVIGPIERMMRLVNQLAQNPLGATEAKKDGLESEESAEEYETKMLEQTLGKIGRLLQVGFGVAGTEIIAKNMGGAGELDVMIPGKKITSIFGFGIIEHFTETCSLLEEDIITYINTIAEIVHGDAQVFHGAANKNIGAAFLLAWKICDGTLPGMRDPRDSIDKPRMDSNEKAKKREGIFVKSTGAGKQQRRIGPTELVDSALTAVLKMRVDVHNANHHGTLNKFCTNKKLLAAFEDFEVHMGFGLHLGWAIEGAIGSRYKIDASYLSPNVNMAARLEAATGQFDIPMLISEWFVDELSPAARRFCRKIDRVAVKGSEIPMDLWTFDIGHYPTEGVQPTIDAEGKQKAVQFAEDQIYRTLQENIPKGFFENFNEGIGAYFGGKWDSAREKLTTANQIWEDGPTKVVLKVMEHESHGTFNAPSWWRGYRQLTEK
ncbi:TPA: hypothetical protein N0F65_010013 [Lagenidium giganteum]|uniref:Guanylate cyclase domain-containing protein n=1 Tax=Lagenidium giganteum TaxID=4803 RepID=A0AAV2ZCE8_9STRA|nr:TPA: hypothetical protein N0F65_010013 [Lagenidium giganteum]